MENWKDIKGYEGLYKVSDHGRVMGLKRGKLLKRLNIKNGTKFKGETVCLSRDSKSSYQYVKKIVYNNFIGEYKGMLQHKDGDYTNCCIDNLEVVKCTKSFKYKHASKVLNTETLEIHGSIYDLAKLIGVTPGAVYFGLKNNGKKYSNYKIID